MNLVHFEIQKILNRKYSIALLLLTLFIFPVLIKVVSHVSVKVDNLPEGLFINNVAFAIIAYSQLYVFLPVWVIVFVGQELTGGHVNRIVFAKSRRFYFSSKLVYCGLITILFSSIGLISFAIAVKTSPFQQLSIAPITYLYFFVQMLAATFAYSIVLLSLIITLHSPILTFVIYFGWTFIEGIIFTLFKGIYNIELSWLPLHLVRTLYTQNGEVTSDNYFNPFIENITATIPSIGFTILLIIIVHRLFMFSNLKPLSD